MKDYFEVLPDRHFKLRRIPHQLKPRYRSDDEYKTLLDRNHQLIEEYQTLLYAGQSRSMLIIFQGMDTSGKDGAIKHVMSGVNPQGCSVVSFKSPTADELEHDFLWRVDRVNPARGQIGIFNRSYYEEVLITRVHPELLKNEKVPRKGLANGTFWKLRYLDILNHESYLHRQGYEIIKIFIHISKGEQKRRLLDRFSDAKKHWKISQGDVTEREFWSEYQKAYEDCVRMTASKSSPWYIVPGNDKKSARLSISQILVNRFERMKLEYPKLSSQEMQKLKKLKSLLTKNDRESR